MIRSFEEIDRSGITGPVISSKDIKDTLDEMERAIKTLKVLSPGYGAICDHLCLKSQSLRLILRHRGIK